MEREYYRIHCTLAGQAHYLIWYSNDPDGLIVNQRGQVMDFPNVSDLDAFGLENHLSIHEGMTPFDLDLIANWVERPAEAQIDCERFLNAWNLFGDLAASVGEAGQAFTEFDDCVETYDKLFHGNNVPALTSPGKEFTPQWTKGDIQELLKVFNAGLALFRKVMRPM